MRRGRPRPVILFQPCTYFRRAQGVNLARRSVYEHRPIAKQAIEWIFGLGKPFGVVGKRPATFSFLNVTFEDDPAPPRPDWPPKRWRWRAYRQKSACFLTANRNACAMVQATLVQLE